MKTRNNRNLFNGDCNVFLYNAKYWQPEGGPFSAKAIHRYVKLLAESGVDTFIINPNTQKAYYPSKVFPYLLEGYTRGNKDFFRGHIPCQILEPELHPEKVAAFLDANVEMYDLYLDLEEAGVDWVAETAKACREYGVSPWVSIRMNDVHGSGSMQGSFHNSELYKNANFRTSGVLPNPDDGVSEYWQGLNYSIKEVRDFMFTLIKELVEDYDFEGMELDWLRNPFCANPGASCETQNAVTSWIGEIREVTNRKANKIGKPYALGMRMPGSLGLLRSLGLDVVSVVRADLIDFVTPSNFWQTSWDMPHDQLRKQLGEKVAIYGCVEDAPNWVPGYSPDLGYSGTRMLSASAPLLHANAAGKLVLGANGIEVFNFYCTDTTEWGGEKRIADYPALRNIESLETLRGKPKHYAFSTMIGGTWYPPFELVEQLPAILEPQWRRAFRLAMCAEPANSSMELTIQIVVENIEVGADIGVSFNGSWPTYECECTDQLLFPTGPFTNHVAGVTAYNFRCESSDICDGWNEIAVYNNRHFNRKVLTGGVATPEERRRDQINIVSIELAVR